MTESNDSVGFLNHLGKLTSTTKNWIHKLEEFRKEYTEKTLLINSYRTVYMADIDILSNSVMTGFMIKQFLQPLESYWIPFQFGFNDVKVPDSLSAFMCLIKSPFKTAQLVFLQDILT